MDDEGAGLIAMVVWAVVGILAALAVVGGGLWVADYGLEATLIDKDCTPISGGIFGGSGGASSSVTVRTKMWGIEHTVEDFPDRQCQTLRTGEDGNFVRYHVRSERTILYDREGGPCIWDSARGLGC